MSGPRILQFGASGQLATAMRERAGRRLLALDRGAADLSVPGAAATHVRDAAADIVVIAAAHTAVDKAESNYEIAHRINADAPGEIAAACAARDLPVIHVSTDYVFDGGAGRPWREDDASRPLNAYGRSKLEGERAVLAANPRAVVIRTSWVFSPWGQNFVRTMLRLAQTRQEIDVVADQLGRPTSALDLAETILAIAPRITTGGPYGVFHFANTGETDWAGFAQAIFDGSKGRGLPSARVRRITTADYPTPARRPANSVLDTRRIETAFGLKPRPWRDALTEVLDRLAAGDGSSPAA